MKNLLYPDYDNILDFTNPKVKKVTEELYEKVFLRVPEKHSMGRVESAVVFRQGAQRKSGSGGKLHEYAKIPWDFVKSYLTFHDKNELEYLAEALVKQGGFNHVHNASAYIKQLRFYGVLAFSNSKDSPGGQEIHRIRQEILGCTKGKVILMLTDFFGGRKTIELIPGDFVYIPPFVQHPYYHCSSADSADSSMLAIANVNIDWNNKLTFDAYYTNDPNFNILAGSIPAEL